MPRRRQPRAIWKQTRARIWQRDQGRCQGTYCREQPPWSVPLDEAHIDHIVSGRQGSNADDNLRVLCRRCHVLRADRRHQGMIAAALRAGIIPPDWRALVWDDEDSIDTRSTHMTNDTIQQAQVTIQGTEPLIYRFDEARSRAHQASAGYDAADLTCSALMLDVETNTLSFSPLVVEAWVREAARSLNREQQRAQLLDLAATIRVLDEQIRITRARPPITTLDARDYPAYLHDHAPRIMGRMETQETASRLWYANFCIQWCGTTTDSGDVRELLDYAGKWIGIGRGTERGFGRFLVHTFGIEIVNRPATA